MLIHAILPVSQANGPGRRTVLFVQGCTLACEGCWNSRTHAFTGPEVSVPDVLDTLLRHVSEQQLHGVTFSGGEPVQQARDVAPLLKTLRAAIPEISIGIFTGYSQRGAQSRAVLDARTE
jgi:anaerobic ribonucleoside-triphosphate reductase activating protein